MHAASDKQTNKQTNKQNSHASFFALASLLRFGGELLHERTRMKQDGGFLIPGDDMIWPLKVFHYILPIKYATRSMNYVDNIDAEYDGCKKYQDDPDVRSKFNKQKERKRKAKSASIMDGHLGFESTPMDCAVLWTVR